MFQSECYEVVNRYEKIGPMDFLESNGAVYTIDVIIYRDQIHIILVPRNYSEIF